MQEECTYHQKHILFTLLAWVSLHSKGLGLLHLEIIHRLVQCKIM